MTTRLENPHNTPCHQQKTGKPLTGALLAKLRGKRVKVHLNLHNGCYVITYKGHVAAYTRAFHLKDAHPRIGLGGYKRCHEEQVRNVHAFLEGELVSAEPPRERGGRAWRSITYNCKTHGPCFYFENDETCWNGSAEVRAWRMKEGDGEKCVVLVRGEPSARRANPRECGCTAPGGACSCGAVDRECQALMAELGIEPVPYAAAAPSRKRNPVMRRFEFTEGTSNKYWEIEYQGSAYTVRWGRIGAAPQQAKKEYGSPKEALAAYEKIVNEKLGKGYVEKSRAEHLTRPAVPPKPHVPKAAAIEPKASAGRARVATSPQKAPTWSRPPTPRVPAGTSKELVQRARHVAVRYTGSTDSVAAAIWVMMQGRLDAALVLDTNLCKANVLRSYGEALAQALDFTFFASEKELLAKWGVKVTGGWLDKPLEGVVVVLPGSSGPAVEERAEGALHDIYGGVVAVRPFLGKLYYDNLLLLDKGNVRPPPSYYLAVQQGDQMSPTDAQLKAAAKKLQASTYEKALVLATVASGKFPTELVLYDTGEKREDA
jgi:predicted DNA-binding WGR domain protein